MCAVMQKSVREAKIHTSWREPNTDYERAVEGFVRGVFADRRLIEEVVAVVKLISPAALVNSLAGVVLRIASPGVPDVYQGAEHWYTRLVDPDNRVAVDFSATVPEKMPAPTDPKIKTHVLSRGLHARREHPDLFASGSYVAIEASGRLRRHVVAFARRRGSDWALACVPRLVARLGTPVGDVWQGTRLVMPSSAPRRWHNVLTDETVASTDLADVLHELPVAIMLA
jgi:(1->4)-alpha-D-glucan 1-alpha-D-glucosylmutase